MTARTEEQRAEFDAFSRSQEWDIDSELDVIRSYIATTDQWGPLAVHARKVAPSRLPDDRSAEGEGGSLFDPQPEDECECTDPSIAGLRAHGKACPMCGAG